MITELHVEADETGTRLDRFLRRQIANLGQAQIEKLLRSGKIRVDGNKVKSNFRVAPPMIVTLPDYLLSAAAIEKPKQAAKPQMDQERAKQILTPLIHAETQDWMALNKPAGLAVQGGSNTKIHIDGLLAATFPEARPKLVHRIDKDTSGLLLVAKSTASARQLTKAFELGAIEKSYLAVVIGDPGPGGLINKPLIKAGGQGKERMVVDYEAGQHAESLYIGLARTEAFSLVALRPLTGRTHQLRIHMADHGTPILGDGKYAGAAAHPRTNANEGFHRQLHLHAQFLTLPDAQRLAAPLPDHMRAAITLLACNDKVPAAMPDFRAVLKAAKNRK